MSFDLDKLIAAAIAMATIVVVTATFAMAHARPMEPAPIIRML